MSFTLHLLNALTNDFDQVNYNIKSQPDQVMPNSTLDRTIDISNYQEMDDPDLFALALHGAIVDDVGKYWADTGSFHVGQAQPGQVDLYPILSTYGLIIQTMFLPTGPMVNNDQQYTWNPEGIYLWCAYGTIDDVSSKMILTTEERSYLPPLASIPCPRELLDGEVAWDGATPLQLRKHGVTPTLEPGLFPNYGNDIPYAKPLSRTRKYGGEYGFVECKAEVGPSNLFQDPIRVSIEAVLGPGIPSDNILLFLKVNSTVLDVDSGARTFIEATNAVAIGYQQVVTQGGYLNPFQGIAIGYGQGLRHRIELTLNDPVSGRANRIVEFKLYFSHVDGDDNDGLFPTDYSHGFIVLPPSMKDVEITSLSIVTVNSNEGWTPIQLPSVFNCWTWRL